MKCSKAQFQKLQREWYRKLKDEGFDDIEKLVGEELELKQSAKLQEPDYENRAQYYRILSQHVNDNEFDCDVDKVIMTRYAEGANAKAICHELAFMSPRRPPRFRSETRRNRNSVRYIIRRYEMLWGLREWDDKHLNRLPRKP